MLPSPLCKGGSGGISPLASSSLTRGATLLIRDFPDETRFLGKSVLWDGANYIPASPERQLIPLHQNSRSRKEAATLIGSKMQNLRDPAQVSPWRRAIWSPRPRCCHQSSPSHSKLPGHRAELVNPFQYPAQHFPGYQHLSKLEYQPPGMADQPSSGLDHPALKTGQSPVLHRLR